MAVATAAEYFSAVTEKAIVRPGDDVLRSNRSRKARPPSTGLVFVFRPVQIESAGCAAVNAMLVIVGVFSGISPFSPFFPQDVVLLRCQLFFLSRPEDKVFELS